MEAPLRMAIIGLGRIGIFHARHIQEIAVETGRCQLTAIADTYKDNAAIAARELQSNQDSGIAAFRSTAELVSQGSFDAVMIASRTADHYQDVKILVEAGYRVLLEKPLSHSLETARELTTFLNSGSNTKNAVMLAFQRRFDQPLVYARQLLAEGHIGRPFKYYSALEDPLPPPEGYSSAGLLIDMSVHNIDEVIWLHGALPHKTLGLGCNLYNQTISSVREDFDDVLLQMWFDGNVAGQVQVSRNHVAGYRNETIIYGDKGLIHVGHFQENPYLVTVEAYSPAGSIAKKSFALREYGDSVPVFIKRFGEAYKAEVGGFVEKCLKEEPFGVTHEDGLRALEVAFAGSDSILTHKDARPVTYF